MNGPVIHGGLSESERAAYLARGVALVDLSASLNPYGPHPRVTRAARGAEIHRYPEADARALRKAYANACSLRSEWVLAGNGSSELIYMAARAAASAGGRSGLVIGPTFGEYGRAIRAAGMAVEPWTAPGPEFRVCVDEIVASIRQRRPAIVFLCNPNNPTGYLLDGTEVEQITAAVRDGGGWTVVDEAYMDFASVGCAADRPSTGQLILRSLTKLHAIPGLRLGFALAEPSIIAAMASLQPPWSVSAPAAAAGLQALQEHDFAALSIRRIGQSRERLLKSLRGAGFQANDSTANFLLVHVGGATGFRKRLMDRGFVVRDCTSFGLLEHVRVAIPRHKELSRLVYAMMATREETTR
jgi:L-threonine-O-3-phosphate decarboxylase